MGDLLMEEAPMVNHLMANHLAMDMVNLLMEEEDLDLMEAKLHHSSCKTITEIIHSYTWYVEDDTLPPRPVQLV